MRRLACQSESISPTKFVTALVLIPFIIGFWIFPHAQYVDGTPFENLNGSTTAISDLNYSYSN